MGREHGRARRDDSIRRSLSIYHAPGRAPRLDEWHRRFLDKGDLAFDVGAHVGDRAASFARLGARVVAVEPQPRLARLLRRSSRTCPQVTVIEALAGAAPGHATLYLNPDNPTVASASLDFIAAAELAPGWEGQRWDGSIVRPVVSLDRLATQFGLPEFVKIDVEGYEAHVLAGLSRAPRTLSFEFTTIQRGVALACLDRLGRLGYRAFNAALGETITFAHARPLPAAAMIAWIGTLRQGANSGDIYASLQPERLRA